MEPQLEVKRRTATALITKLASVSDQTRIAALCELRLLTKTDPEIRPIIAQQEGAITYIADTLYSPTPLLQENAAATLLNLSITSRAALLSTPGLLDALSHSLSHHLHHHPSAVQSSAATVFSLLLDDSHRHLITSRRDLVFALIDIIRSPHSPPRSIKDSLKALFGMSLHPPCRQTIVDLGAVAPLFAIVRERAVGLAEDATAVIAQIAACEEAAREFRKVAGVRVLVDVLDVGTGSSGRMRENSVSALLNLVVSGGESVRAEITEVGVEMAVVGLREVANNGTVKGKKRAEGLIKILEGREGGFNVSGSDFRSGPLLDSHSY